MPSLSLSVPLKTPSPGYSRSEVTGSYTTAHLPVYHTVAFVPYRGRNKLLQFLFLFLKQNKFLLLCGAKD